MKVCVLSFNSYPLFFPGEGVVSSFNRVRMAHTYPKFMKEPSPSWDLMDVTRAVIKGGNL